MFSQMSSNYFRALISPSLSDRLVKPGHLHILLGWDLDPFFAHYFYVILFLAFLSLIIIIIFNYLWILCCILSLLLSFFLHVHISLTLFTFSEYNGKRNLSFSTTFLSMRQQYFLFLISNGCSSVQLICK